MPSINGFVIDISDPQGWNFTGTAVIPPELHELPRGNAFYIGGDTPHIWTKEQIVRQANAFRLPIWVYNPEKHGAASAVIDSAECVKALREIGVPSGKLVALDMETFIDPEYTKAFSDGITDSGYKYLLYESASDTSNFVGPIGRWDADWTGKRHINDGSWGTQYADSTQLGHPFDISAVSSVDDLWNIKADQNPPPPIPKPTPKSYVIGGELKITYSDGVTQSLIVSAPGILKGVTDVNPSNPIPMAPGNSSRESNS